jgi:enoyl-CoA hydratase/carnithine racemase
MRYEKVMVAIGPNHVAELTLNRPEHLNTLDSPMAEELYQALMELDVDPKVRVVLLKGAGKAFCAGKNTGNGSNAWSAPWLRSRK